MPALARRRLAFDGAETRACLRCCRGTLKAAVRGLDVNMTLDKATTMIDLALTNSQQPRNFGGAW